MSIVKHERDVIAFVGGVCNLAHNVGLRLAKAPKGYTGSKKREQMDKIICEIWIIFFGGTAIWLVGRLDHWKRWGYVLGLLSQPAWLYTTIKHEQWGILALSLWYTYSWGQGIYNYWIRKTYIEKLQEKVI